MEEEEHTGQMKGKDQESEMVVEKEAEMAVEKDSKEAASSAQPKDHMMVEKEQDHMDEDVEGKGQDMKEEKVTSPTFGQMMEEVKEDTAAEDKEEGDSSSEEDQEKSKDGQDDTDKMMTGMTGTGMSPSGEGNGGEGQGGQVK